VRPQDFPVQCTAVLESSEGKRAQKAFSAFTRAASREESEEEPEVPEVLEDDPVADENTDPNATLRREDTEMVSENEEPALPNQSDEEDTQVLDATPVSFHEEEADDTEVGSRTLEMRRNGTHDEDSKFSCEHNKLYVRLHNFGLIRVYSNSKHLPMKREWEVKTKTSLTARQPELSCEQSQFGKLIFSNSALDLIPFRCLSNPS
jgi:hypothetical protein